MARKALIFVGLGSLTECAEADRQAWNASFSSHGLRWYWSWETYAELMRHGGDRMPAERYANFVGADIDTTRLVATHHRSFAARLSGDIPVRPGVAETLSWAAKRGLSLGFVSRHGAAQVHAVLAATARARAGVEFDAVISRADVARLAPHPDAVQSAMAQLDVSEAVVVSDTPAGAAGALDAGAQVLSFPGLLAEELHFPEGCLPTRAPTPETVARLIDADRRTAAE